MGKVLRNTGAVIYSCVVDRPSVLQLQAHYLVASLLDQGKVPPADIIVHTVADLAPEFGRWLDEAGVRTVRVERHRHPYCNKLQQLQTFAGMASGHVVLLDCDIAVAGVPEWPRPALIAAKPVDAPLPPERILGALLKQSGLAARWVDADLLSGPEGRRTLKNNCNGGVYVLAGSFIKSLEDSWRRWADWCLERVGLFEAYSVHVDQVALALALAELKVDAERLDRRFNFPTHLRLPPEADCDPVLLHYHRHLTSQLELKSAGLPRVDAAIARVNERITARRSDTLLNSIFWGARYELFPDLGSGVGSRGEALAYKRRLLSALVGASKERSVLEVGCGDLEVSSVLKVERYVGIDAAPSAIEIARKRRPDWTFRVANPLDPGTELDPAQVVVCLDVLIHQPTRESYERLVERLASLAQGTLIVGAYDAEPVHNSSVTYYYEPLTETLARIGGFDEISAVGGYRDVTVVVARRGAGTGHKRDMPGRDVTLMSHLVDDPLVFRGMVDLARSTIGFFPAHNPRAIEYTWIATRIGAAKGLSVLDVGAGVNPLPFWLARNGAQVTTVDSHTMVRDPAQRQTWNEWGFLDYSRLDRRIKSINAAFEELEPRHAFDVLFSVSVIEHLPTQVRDAWMRRFAQHLRPGGRLLLTVDLVPWSDALWPYREGKLIEDPEVHGSLRTFIQQLPAFGIALSRVSVRKHVHQSRVALGLIEARVR